MINISKYFVKSFELENIKVLHVGYKWMRSIDIKLFQQTYTTSLGSDNGYAIFKISFKQCIKIYFDTIAMQSGIEIRIGPHGIVRTLWSNGFSHTTTFMTKFSTGITTRVPPIDDTNIPNYKVLLNRLA